MSIEKRVKKEVYKVSSGALSFEDAERVRNEARARLERKKLESCGMPHREGETEILERALCELAMIGRTNITCPRCGHKLTLILHGSTGEIKCSNPNLCIKYAYHGL
jgi:hypothetical protein